MELGIINEKTMFHPLANLPRGMGYMKDIENKLPTRITMEMDNPVVTDYYPAQVYPDPIIDTCRMGCDQKLPSKNILVALAIIFVIGYVL